MGCLALGDGGAGDSQGGEGTCEDREEHHLNVEQRLVRVSVMERGVHVVGYELTKELMRAKTTSSRRIVWENDAVNE